MINYKIIIVFIVGLICLSCEKDVPEPKYVNIEGGESFEFYASNTSSSSDLVWDMGDGSILHERAPIYSYTSAGTYWVSFTEYSKSGNFKRKVTSHKVNVSKIKKPRIDSVGIYSDNKEYTYVGLESYLRMYLNEDLEDERNYKYEISIDDVVIDTSDYTRYIFSDTGRYLISFKITDKYGGSSSIDTNIIVGSDESKLNFVIPDVLASQTGSVTEKYLIILEYDFYYYDLITDLGNYKGPSITNLIVGGEICYYYNTGINDYFYSSMGELNYNVMGNVSNGMQASITVPAYDYKDKDNLYVVAVIVGANGMAIGNSPISLYPGINNITPFTLNMNFEGY